ncbi:hypothetical protein ILYODFUR_033609 [Ilyodon furcidens]|uniref:Ribonuclease A-domain domain-containing protein n=1 Tax=Ilyodon furcidens TaxID=33524 RepID=A0ABV0U007_9TELE
MKTLCGVLLLMLLSVACLSQAEGLNVVAAMEPGECTARMNEMVNTQSKCSNTDTFIVSQRQNVDNVCQGINGKMTKPSAQIFQVVDCTHDRASAYPNCRYRGNAHTKTKLYLECRNNQALRFVSAERLN